MRQRILVAGDGLMTQGIINSLKAADVDVVVGTAASPRAPRISEADYDGPPPVAESVTHRTRKRGNAPNPAQRLIEKQRQKRSKKA